LAAELSDREGPFEVGYLGSQRVTWKPEPAPLPLESSGEPLFGPGTTVLVTGGARGIASAIVIELARRYRPKLVLIGRSPLPPDVESPDTAGLQAPAEIKAALIDRCQREGRPAVPAEIEAAYQRLTADREIRRTLALARQSGAVVEYHSLDVRDEAAMREILADLDRRHGGADVVLHAAGVIEDKLVRDKTPESFERVFSTKADSAMILARLLRPEQVKACVLFASIASRYGNAGQADYAAANEVLSKLAAELDRRWPGRVVSIAWGPWSELGMVAHLEKHLAARGVALMTPDVGTAFLIDELNHAVKGEPEVLVAGGAVHLVAPGRGVNRAAETVLV
jgi:NAD(P)-dependent dehydrogenase (short-subunit alcohol dehydrogenase family)